MKKYTIQIETQFDLVDLLKIINKYEKIGAIKLNSILENKNE